MKTIIEPTEEQFKTLLDKYYANRNERSKLITTKVNNIARRLNKKLQFLIILATLKSGYIT